MSMDRVFERLHQAAPESTIYWVSPMRDISMRVSYEDAPRVRALLGKSMELTSESCASVTARGAKGMVLVTVDAIPAQVGAVALAEHVAAGGACTPEAVTDAWNRLAAAMTMGAAAEPSTEQVRLLAEMLLERVASDDGPPSVTMQWIERASAALRAEPSIAAAARILTSERPVRLDRVAPRGEPPTTAW